MRVSTEQGFASRLTLGTIVRAWALTQRGQGEEGLRQCARAWQPTSPRG